MGKFKASKLIVKESWNILKQDKEIMWFPVLSFFSSLILFLILCLTFFYHNLGGDFDNLKLIDPDKFDYVSYSYFLAYYVLSFFIVNFFQAGIFIIASARFNNQNLTFGNGMSIAVSKINKIFFWSLISATVGVILNFIAEKFELVGKIVSMILGAAWNILTYFSLPSLVTGNMSVRDSFKDSASIIRKTWGESIIVNTGAGLFFLGLILASIFFSFVIVWVIPQLFILVTILLFLFIISISIVSSALNSIFKLALYQYAKTGTVPQGFDPELIVNAVKSK